MPYDDICEQEQIIIEIFTNLFYSDEEYKWFVIDVFNEYCDNQACDFTSEDILKWFYSKFNFDTKTQMWVEKFLH